MNVSTRCVNIQCPFFLLIEKKLWTRIWVNNWDVSWERGGGGDVSFVMKAAGFSHSLWGSPMVHGGVTDLWQDVVPQENGLGGRDVRRTWEMKSSVSLWPGNWSMLKWLKRTRLWPAHPRDPWTCFFKEGHSNIIFWSAAVKRTGAASGSWCSAPLQAHIRPPGPTKPAGGQRLYTKVWGGRGGAVHVEDEDVHLETRGGSRASCCSTGSAPRLDVQEDVTAETLDSGFQLEPNQQHPLDCSSPLLLWLRSSETTRSSRGR